MSEATPLEQEMSPEQSLIADLTKTAVGILNDRQAVFTTSEDGSQTREVTTPNNGGCALIETLTPEGIRNLKYIRPVMTIELGEVLKTTEWQEDSSVLSLTYETEADGRRTASISDPIEISYSTQLCLSRDFPLPEKQQRPQKDASRPRALMGRLILRWKQAHY